MDFTQANVNAFAAELPNTAIYFSQGTYLTYGATPANSLALVAGQQIYGRTIDYLNPAPPEERPIFSGTLQLNTGNKVSDVKSIYPGGASPNTGINLAQGAVGIVIEKSEVGSALNPAQRFNIGIGSAGVGPFSNEVLVKQVTIFAGNRVLILVALLYSLERVRLMLGWACSGVYQEYVLQDKTQQLN